MGDRLGLVSLVIGVAMRLAGGLACLAFAAVAAGFVAVEPARADDFSWTGVYFGVNAGVARGTSDLTTSANPAFFNQFGTDALASLNRAGPRSLSAPLCSGVAIRAESLAHVDARIRCVLMLQTTGGLAGVPPAEREAGLARAERATS